MPDDDGLLFLPGSSHSFLQLRDLHLEAANFLRALGQLILSDYLRADLSLIPGPDVLILNPQFSILLVSLF